MTFSRRPRVVTAAVVVIIATSVAVAVALTRQPADVAMVGVASPIAPPPSTLPSHAPTPIPDPLPSSEMPAAWLAWIAGSLPVGFATDAERTAALGETVVVAGDTRWMHESRDPDGKVIDRPRPSYAIPVDAFAVAPRAYAPFLPDRYRREVLEALRNGEAVLGQTSAMLRRAEPGAMLRFARVRVDVGAVVPDDVVGYAEIMVSREVGRRLGIVRDRYLLAQPDRMTRPRFERIMRRLLPGTDVETMPPGGSPYMRIASGVNPPVVTKTVFGEFSAVPQADPAYLTIDPRWVAANIRVARVPLLGRVTCHRSLIRPLIDALTEIRRAGLGDTIRVYSGCFAARTVGRSSTTPPSQHAYGAAIDINAPFSPYGAPPNFDPRAVAILESHGFNWGGDFLIPDGHHFEWGLRTPPPD